MPPKGRRKPSKQVNIKDSRGFVIGDFATVVNNFWDEKILKRFGLEQRAGFLILFITILGVGLLLYFGLRPDRPPQTMSGTFRIAVASFHEIGSSHERNLGYDLAEIVHLRLKQDLEELDSGLGITIWGPDQVGSITGDTVDQRARHAEKIASDIKADMVVYGVVDSTTEPWQVLPEFIISAENFDEAREIVGRNDLGTPIALPGAPGASNTAWRFEFGRQMVARGTALSMMSLGLGYVALHRYEEALEAFQSGLSIDRWDDEQGKKVLYILAGFAAGKVGESNAQGNMLEEAQQSFDLSEDLLKKAASIDPQYARPLIGLANLSYMRAMQPFNQSENREDIDTILLDDCFRYLDMAQSAAIKPPLADADTKIHFSRGQCSMMYVYSGQGTDLAPAIREFEQVIGDFGDGANPRIQELAAEAHARLALIYRWLGEEEMAVQEYELAAGLLSRYPDRQKVFLDRREELLNGTATP